MDLASTIPDRALLNALAIDGMISEPVTVRAQLANLRIYINLGQRLDLLTEGNGQVPISIEHVRQILTADAATYLQKGYESIEPMVRALSEQRLQKQLNALIAEGYITTRATRKDSSDA